MRAADVVAITSVWESGPLTLLEAGAVAAPVVTTPVGFVPEVVHDGVEGRIVPVGDVGGHRSGHHGDDGRHRHGAADGGTTPRGGGSPLDREAPRRAVEAVYGRVAGQGSAS